MNFFFFWWFMHAREARHVKTIWGWSRIWSCFLISSQDSESRSSKRQNRKREAPNILFLVVLWFILCDCNGISSPHLAFVHLVTCSREESWWEGGRSWLPQCPFWLKLSSTCADLEKAVIRSAHTDSLLCWNGFTLKIYQSIHRGPPWGTDHSESVARDPRAGYWPCLVIILSWFPASALKMLHLGDEDRCSVVWAAHQDHNLAPMINWRDKV